MATSSDFRARIGVNIHMDATATPYGNAGGVAAALAYLGIGLVRDEAYDINLPGFQRLAADGTKFDLIVDDDAENEVGAMRPLGASVVSFEGGNEVDIYPAPGVTDTVAGAVAEQQLLYGIVKAAFGGIPVLNQSVGYPTDYPDYAGALRYSDVANVHAYAGDGMAPFEVIRAILQVEYPDRTKPAQITETGYYDLPSDSSGVDAVVQAKYTLDTLFDTALLGVANTFLYELFDELPDPEGVDPEQHYGLFNNDGSPKPVAVAIHNLMQILAGSGTAGAAALALVPRLTGLPASGHSLTLDGANNSKFIAVWAEPEIWNQDTHSEIAIAPRSVTVNLGTSAASVSVYDPLVSTAPIAVYANASKVVLGVTDHPLIIQASAAAAVVPVVPGVPAGDAGADVFRFFDQRYGTHFYSASTAERDAIEASRQDLVYEGVGFGSAAEGAPVYRFFEGSFGTHFYTTSAAERDEIAAGRPDLVYEGVGFYEHATQQAGDAAVYRLFDTQYGTHFYTADAKELATVKATRSDLVDEGVAFYAPAAGA